ncbi:exodeoxyribonuclease VII large subunit [Tissierella sp. MSJ-40]|uniref:Exodeoxyribonuclease 7 large subunit n=1 Tax=Tissierella simiarum TaxID=2841534 RepID=A0ABS6E3T8_9FIRM|nr:exodeoxyribonuclease VII large subunit [Tissierella simiarum]MBU5437555.1 exodeoxyribonuclease VII large subunit [Tissierella simiarum]
MSIKPLKVSEVNSYIKRVFLSDLILSNISVEGEISNFKHHYSGHMYFSLKDHKGKIRCVMFKGDNELINFKLKDGMKVVVTGYISIYEKEGDYQLYVRTIEESGVGDLYKAFEELKRKLELEGLFHKDNKKEIPFMPNKIGIVTSSTGAAIRDIITIIKRRFSSCELLIYPTLVQGSQAPTEICRGLAYLDSREDIDLIITGRGGGSIEELYAFNDEEVARTIYNLKTPVISAIGHETDFTIADFVADLRAATPSAAAELAVPEQSFLLDVLNSKYNRLLKIYYQWKKSWDSQLKYLNTSLIYYNPINQLRDKKQELDGLFKDLSYIIERKINDEENKLAAFNQKLILLNPNSSLDRGYGVLTDGKGNLIKSIKEVNLNEELKILIKDGIIKAKVVNIEKGGD